MNILLFVLAMLMILGALTYQRLENFVDMTLVRKEWTRSMDKQEREDLQEKAENAYAKTAVKEGNNNGHKPVPANSTLNIASLFTEKGNRQHTAEILRSLILVLFQNHPFFLEAAQKRPNYIEEIIEGLKNPKDFEGKELKITTATKLSWIHWQDPELQKIFGQMIKESPPLKPEENEQVTSSLTDYLTVNKIDKIRIYLAPRNLLIAIFGSPEAADEVITFRANLFNQLRNSTADDANTTLGSEFENQFKGRIPAEWLPMMNFEVSKTNPNNR